MKCKKAAQIEKHGKPIVRLLTVSHSRTEARPYVTARVRLHLRTNVRTRANKDVRTQPEHFPVFMIGQVSERIQVLMPEQVSPVLSALCGCLGLSSLLGCAVWPVFAGLLGCACALYLCLVWALPWSCLV